MRISVGKGIATTQGGALTREEMQTKVRVPDLNSFFKIEEAKSTIVRDDAGQPGQVLIINTTAAVRSEDLQKALHVFLLPRKPVEDKTETTSSDAADEGEQTADTASGEDWSSPQEIDDEILQHARPVPLTVIPSQHEQTQYHAFNLTVGEKGTRYVRIYKPVQAHVGVLPVATYKPNTPDRAITGESPTQSHGSYTPLNV